MATLHMADVSEQIRGVSYKPEDVCDETDNDAIGILRANNINDGKINFDDLVYVKKTKVSPKQLLRNGDILICASSGSKIIVGKAAQIEGNCSYSFGAFCKVVRPKGVNPKFLGSFFQSNLYKNYISGVSHGANIYNIKNEHIDIIEIHGYDNLEQERIATLVKKASTIIEARKQQLSALDTLIKARFVEMFGDPVSNPKGWPKVRLSDLAEIKIGPFGSLLHKEDYGEGGHALVNPSHIVGGKISTDDKLTIADQKFNELSAYHLQLGDVVMGRRGEMGRCAVVEVAGLLCGTSSLLIRTRGEVKPDHIQKIISFPSFKKTIEDMAVGQTMPNLNVPIVAGFQIIKPPIEVQESYYAFVAQVDKSKAVVQKALDEAQLLFDSLMQKYFG